MEHFETRTQQETLADNFCADLENLETEIDDCSLDFQTTIIDDLNQISDIVMESFQTTNTDDLNQISDIVMESFQTTNTDDLNQISDIVMENILK